jgi:hypothetical protein
MADKPAAGEAAKKVDPRVEALKKNHFWILAALLLVTALIVWWMGTAALANQYRIDEATNNRAFGSLTAYKTAGVNTPPNAQYAVAVKKENNELGKQVVDTWQTLFDRQKGNLKKNALVGQELFDLVLLDINERKAAFQKNGDKILFHIQNFHNGQIIESEFNDLFKMLN